MNKNDICTLPNILVFSPYFSPINFTQKKCVLCIANMKTLIYQALSALSYTQIGHTSLQTICVLGSTKKFASKLPFRQVFHSKHENPMVTRHFVSYPRTSLRHNKVCRRTYVPTRPLSPNQNRKFQYCCLTTSLRYFESKFQPTFFASQCIHPA